MAGNKVKNLGKHDRYVLAFFCFQLSYVKAWLDKIEKRSES